MHLGARAEDVAEHQFVGEALALRRLPVTSDPDAARLPQRKCTRSP